MKITFNTGRLYTREGQIITAAYSDEDKKVYFSDHSRMIVNQMFDLDLPEDFVMTASFLAKRVMQEYDNSRFTYAPWDKEPKREPSAVVHEFRL